MNVLLFTRTGDEYATQPVAEAIRRRGARPWLLESDRYPGELGLSWRGPQQGWLELPEGRLPLAELGAIWNRRDVVGTRLPQDWPADLREVTRKEASTLLHGALHDSPAFWVDPPSAVLRARSKGLQLPLARRAGLEVPATLESNDPEAVRAFAQAHPGGIIAKMYNDFRMGDGTVYTNVLGPEDLAALDSLQTCPMIFQEAIPKARELRVVTVGLRTFAAALETRELAGAEQDWRRVGAETVHLWRPFELPDAVSRALLALHDALGTQYGSADFIQTPDGRLVFLENNVIGECFWMYELLGVHEALAELLTDRAPRRPVPADLR